MLLFLRIDLDHDHYGLEKLKKRVIEYLAVRKLKNSLKGNTIRLLASLKTRLPKQDHLKIKCVSVVDKIFDSFSSAKLY